MSQVSNSTMDVMIFNLTTEVEEKFTQFRAVFSLVSVMCLYLPSFLLSLAVLIAVLYSKKINPKIKIVIANIVLYDLTLLLTEIFRSLLPVLYYTRGTDVATHCKVGIYFYFVTTESKQFTISMYCFVMFYIVKHKASNLKWKIVLVGLLVPIFASILWNQMVFYNDFFITGEIGFCFVLRHSPLLTTKLVSLFLEGFLLTGLSIAFITAIIVYIKRNTIDDPTIKQGLLKTAVALATISTFSFITSTLPVLMSRIQPEPTVTFSSEVWRRFLPQTILFSVGSWPVLVTPICLVLTLRPLRKIFIQAAVHLRCSKQNKINKNLTTGDSFISLDSKYVDKQKI